MMTFSKSISTCFSKYFTFSGRASRSEYWWWYLFSLLVTSAARAIDYALLPESASVVIDPSFGELLMQSKCATIATIALFFPSLTVFVRRLHDSNHSGWWILFPLYNIILMFSPSDPEENDYGTLAK